jgi:hypothetical protein
MAKRRKRRRRFTAARHGKSAYCRTFTASDCSIKIGGRRYKGKGRYCPVGKIRVCPLKRGRKTSYKVVGSGGKMMALKKIARRRRHR